MLGRGGGSASTTLTWAAVTATRSSLAAFLGEPCDRWGAQKKCILASRRCPAQITLAEICRHTRIHTGWRCTATAPSMQFLNMHLQCSSAQKLI